MCLLHQNTIDHFGKSCSTSCSVINIVFTYLDNCRTFIIPIQGDDMELSHGHIGAALAIGFAIDSCMFIPVGYVMDKYGRKRTGIPAFLILSAGLLLLPTADTFTTLCIVSMVCGFGNGLSNGLNLTLGGDLAPPAPHASEFLGVWSLICDGGSMFGPTFVGAIAHQASLGTASVVSAMLGFVGLLWYSLFTPETLKQTTLPT
jgi:MFS family permease